jgi:tRNA pseudouridine65 synthase
LLEILLQNQNYVFINKPRGYHVVPHEDPKHRVHKSHVCLYQLRDQLGLYLYPIHRLDVATTGVVGFALNSAAAAHFQKMSQEGLVRKNYLAIVRGWPYHPKPLQENLCNQTDWIEINIPLESDSSDLVLQAETHIRAVEKFEIPLSVGKNQHHHSRYALIEAIPKTGRFHQIRRHLNRCSWPIIGDVSHGDSHHNRFFREKMKNKGLLLHASSLEFPDMTHELIRAKASMDNDFTVTLNELRSFRFN